MIRTRILILQTSGGKAQRDWSTTLNVKSQSYITS